MIDDNSRSGADASFEDAQSEEIHVVSGMKKAAEKRSRSHKQEEEDTRIVAGNKMPDEQVEDAALRPKTLSEYIGQTKVKEKMRIAIQALRKRRQEQSRAALDHVLLYGPPGLGKTTLANIISTELQVSLRTTSGPAIEKPGDLAAILSNLQQGDVLFIDEIHRMNRSVEEILYPALEDYELDIILGKGPSARSMRLPLAPFTLIGATTRLGMLSSPLRDRFGIVERLELYEPEDLRQIVTRSARVLGVPIEEEGAWEIARRSRGTPRIANRLLRRVRDFADVKGQGIITKEVADQALTLHEVDALGIDGTDRRFLNALVGKFGGGPTGLDTLAAATGEERGTIEDVIEPFLLQLGFIQRTPRGRVATKRAFEYLGVPMLEEMPSLQFNMFEDSVAETGPEEL